MKITKWIHYIVILQENYDHSHVEAEHLHHETSCIRNLWKIDKILSKLASSGLNKHISLLWSPNIMNL